MSNPSATSLFIRPPVFLKTAYANVSQNPDDWQHDITRLAYEQIPYVMSRYRTKIKMQRVDQSKGYGYGFISVNNRATIPITIHDFEMDPLDLIYVGKTPYPLNERRIDEMLFNSKTVGQPKDVSDIDGGNFSGMYPPNTGKYVYASKHPLQASRFPAMLDEISGRVRAGDVKKLGTDLLEDSLRAGFRMNGTLRVLSKFAGLKPAKIASALNHVPNNITQVIRHGPGEFLVRFASDVHWDPKEFTVSREKVFKLFGEKVAEKALVNSEFSWSEGRRPWEPMVWEDEEDRTGKPSKLSKPGYYRVRIEGGDALEGWFFPKVVDLEGGSTGTTLITDGSAYALQDDIFGFEAEPQGEGPGLKSPETVGERGCFQLADGKVTLPMVITSPPIDLGAHMILEVTDDLGMPYTLEITPGVEGIQKSRKPNTFLVSNTLPWFRIGARDVHAQDDATPKLEKGKLKVATEKGKKSTVLLTLRDDGSFSLAGDIGAMQGKTSHIDRYRAKFHLMAIGMSPEMADYALNRVKEAGRLTIMGGKVPTSAAEKFGEALTKSARLDSKVFVLRPGLLKEAAVIDDEATIDRVLSLNLVTPENLKVFLESIPVFEEAVTRLAQLLVLCRVGQKNIPEAAVKRAMEGIETVTQILRDLQAGMRQQQSQGNSQMAANH